MRRCLDLARNGLGTTYPNPMVGAVLVYDDKIIGEGWHQQAGKAHAEVNAIQQVKDESLLKKATLYVNLEPCSHYGKTPPCSDLIIEKKIPNVVIGMMDPFEKVAGRGIKKLIDEGCHVQVGVLEDECLALNQRFLTFHLKKRPYIILKWATSRDGFLSPYRYPNFPNKTAPVWISNAVSKQLVHRWRSEEQAILVGANTVLADNPKLTTRLWHGPNPTRVVLDPNLQLNADASIFNDEAKTIWIYDVNFKRKPTTSAQTETIDFSVNVLPQLMKVLHDNEIQSILIEGGAYTLNQFIDENLWDEARVFTGDILFHQGTASPNLPEEKVKEKLYLHTDQLKIYTND